MNSSRLLRGTGAGLAAAVAALAWTATPAQASAGPASASPQAQASPFAAQGCSGDVCISCPARATEGVRAVLARRSSFDGYFHLPGPNGLSANSSTITWIGGKGTTTSGTASPP